MIHLKELTTVEFGKEQKGSIAVSSSHITLSLQELLKDKNIGDTLIDEDIKELPSVTVTFNHLDFLYKMVKQLNELKDNWEIETNRSIIFSKFDSSTICRLNNADEDKNLLNFKCIFYQLTSVEILIKHLNSIERNWMNYYSYALAC